MNDVKSLLNISFQKKKQIKSIKESKEEIRFLSIVKHYRYRSYIELEINYKYIF